MMDMARNVWEWCLNKYDKREARVLRGGSWVDRPEFLRSSSFRDRLLAGLRDNQIGFRLAAGH
jgi:formylglycine-generating enzyme required for sulfatase activity